MIIVTKTDKPSGRATRVEIPEGKDVAAVLNAVRAGLGFKTMAEDLVHDEIMAVRRRDAQGDGVGPHKADGTLVAGTTTTFPRRWSGDEHRPPVSRPAGGSAQEPAGDRGARPDRGARVPRGAAGGEDRGADLLLGVGPSPLGGGRETSRSAYRKARFSGKLTRQQEVVVAWLRGRVGDATRQEIARGTGLGINAVCGRVNELLDPEIGVLRETGKRKCRATGETANTLVLA